MKVLYIVNGIRGSGGLERVLLHKASYLCGTYGYAVRILVLNEAPGEPFYPVSAAVEVRHFHASGSAVAYLRAYRKGLRQAVAQFQPRSTFFGPMPPTIAATQPVLGSTIVTPDCSCSVSSPDKVSPLKVAK